MKAVICTQYGSPDFLQLQEVEKPIPKDNEVLIKIVATTVSSGDDRIRGLNVPAMVQLPMRLMMGFSKPKKVLGSSLAGEIEAVGKAVTRFEPGDQVFGFTGFGLGCHAEYACLPEDGILAIKPSTMSFEEAASIFFGGSAALHFLRQGNIQRGQKVLIYGASGSIGVYAVQLAKYFGAEVTGVCSTSNVEMVKALGADHVIDYTKTDSTQNGETYDIIFDTVGKSSFSGCVTSLKEKGVYLRAVHMELSPVVQGLWTSLTTSKKVIGGVASERREDLIFLSDLVEAGTIKTVVDRCYPLEQIAEAYRYVETGRKKGDVVITVAHQN